MPDLRLFAPALIATLAACGGGGGGGGGVVEVPFTSFSSISGNQTIVMTGIAYTADGTNTLGGSITSLNISGLHDGSNTTAKLTYQGFGGLSSINLSTPTSSIALGVQSCSSGVCSAENDTSLIVAVDAVAVGWNYQTYGIWLKELNATSFQTGVMSAGAVTPGNAVPTIGNNITFTGMTSGFYVDSGAVPYVTSSGMTAIADFANRSIAFSTTGTLRANLITGVQTIDNDLNLTGTLTYAAGSNQFTGPVNTQNAQLTGRADGRFYGPAAQEIGGVYSLSGTGSLRMMGAFGGKQ